MSTWRGLGTLVLVTHGLTVQALLGFVPHQGETVVLKSEPGAGRRPSWWGESSLILISHDLGVLAETCDRIAIMYAGRIVETGPVERRLRGAPAPLHEAPARLAAGDRRAARAGAARSRAARPTRARCPTAAGSVPAVRTPPSGASPIRRCARSAPGQARRVTSRRGRSGRPRQGPGRGGAAHERRLMEVRDLAVQFRRAEWRRARARRRLAGVAARRDARGGRRVGLRQVDAGARDARAGRTGGGRGRAGGPGGQRQGELGASCAGACR